MTEQKIEQFWRDATAGDTTSGKHLAARFRDYPNGNWADNRTLAGWRRIAGEPSLIFYDEAGVAWFQCQVYEPQQWWLDKPDPGKGWRLLEKFPDEPKLNTDEFFDTFDNAWLQVGDNGCAQYHGVWYRRRIEPVKQDAGSTSASNIPKGWTALSLDEPRLASDAYWSALVDSWVLIGDTRLESANREKWPAIRQVENWRCMMLMEGCFYMLPNGHGIKVTKQGFEVF
jgi:hypothetical protein